MEWNEYGVFKKSKIYFSTPSQMAKRLLYYPIAAGHFHCNNAYHVERDHYDSILLLYIVDGSMTLKCKNNEGVSAEKGEVLLINCYEYHKYYSNSSAQTLWLHFDGANSLELYKAIINAKGQKIKCNLDMEKFLLGIMNDMTSITEETVLSQKIYRILCELISSNETKEFYSTNQIEDAKVFMRDNMTSNITVNDIAKFMNMSSSYFYRIFKENTGFTPYDYLQQLRLIKAKELLQQTNHSVEEIAYQTGFNSDSNFIYFFKKETGLSPLKFRKIKF